MPVEHQERKKRRGGLRVRQNVATSLRERSAIQTSVCARQSRSLPEALPDFESTDSARTSESSRRPFSTAVAETPHRSRLIRRAEYEPGSEAEKSRKQGPESGVKG